MDVFTDRPFAGNPLAVVYDATALPTPALQALAREFHLSETAFPLPPTVAGADYRLRIFTPELELPFAGHPSVGAAWALRDDGRLSADSNRVVQECGAGLLPVDFLADGSVQLTGGPPIVGPPLDPGPLLAACRLAPGDAAPARPRVAGTGIDFTVLAVRADAVARARPDLDAVRALGGAGLAVVAVGDGARSAHLRVFAAGAGVAEDPATGSAATALGAYLVAEGLLPGDGTSRVEVRQGAELARPSRLLVTVGAADGAATTCQVAGRVVPVARGRIGVPAG
ncbi:MAG: PhzF family phenazine biosynthesis protein [Mycobacteriales bacterium]